MSKRNIQVIGIDWQNDFCVADDGHGNKGTLVVTGALEDAKRFADLITRRNDDIVDIHMTLDLHHRLDIAHPLFWRDKDNNHPAPLTWITEDDVANGKWRPFMPSLQGHALHYVSTLAKNSRYILIVWPEHCRIGHWGSNLVPFVWDAVSAWEDYPGQVDYVSKGSNYKTEHYSAVQADVPDPSDQGTQLNVKLITTLQEADEIWFTGQAKNFCVANTGRDIIANFGPEAIKKVIFVTDCMSNVLNQPGGPDIEALGEAFINDMVALGCKTALSTEL